MVLTTGAQRELYLQIDIKKNEYIDHMYNVETNEATNGVVNFYYYIYDENHTPYSTPKMDSLNDYMVVLKNGKELTLNQFLEQNGYYSNYYAVISNHNKITSIEHFRIGRHDNFYAIQINKDLANLLNTVGLENVSVQEHLNDHWEDNYYLPTITVKSGYELLFFLTASSIINDEFNYIRREIISNNLKQMIRDKINLGKVFVLEDNSMVHLTYTLKDKLELDKSKRLKLNTLVNNGKAYLITENDLKNIYSTLTNNEIEYKSYLDKALSESLEYWLNWREWGEM